MGGASWLLPPPTGPSVPRYCHEATGVPDANAVVDPTGRVKATGQFVAPADVGGAILPRPSWMSGMNHALDALREKFGGFPTGSRGYPDGLPAVRLVARVSQQDSRGISWSPRDSIEGGPRRRTQKIASFHPAGFARYCSRMLPVFFTLYYNHLHSANFNLLPRKLQLVNWVSI
jgi:hypothetical protein